MLSLVIYNEEKFDGDRWSLGGAVPSEAIINAFLCDMIYNEVEQFSRGEKYTNRSCHCRPPTCTTGRASHATEEIITLLESMVEYSITVKE
ncbi:hypothetical protein F2Q70_00020777 [Brassica cretica]|nr:hypothetical protein F2Q70_00020777 [Brassica cretica]